jgi:hypothetical protein
MSVGIGTDQVPVFMKCMWVVAWVAHIVMSVQWIRNARLSKLWPAIGVASGLGSFLILIILPVAMFIQLLLVLPCVLLSFWLIKFHWAKPV